ncbi:hypothetical protein HOLleu_09754 [Holothuria leucospilota]|uniref:Uncharacterized protein n=1 Tax=Holothuria leucospilota TaxID=206669 RepID=A0A9Q1CDX1_HOLLE|nr:hypothetical protein HOLleu_09754 [Holothuria leucospilota]
MVAAHTARRKKAFTTAEELILPSFVDMCQEILGGAAVTKRVRCGAVKQIQERAPHAKWTHCFFHRENMATKHMSPEFQRSSL